jgi:death-on-curing protein
VTVWLSRQLILAIHDEQLAEHGGSAGIRDEGLLESALARPLNRAGYGEPDVAELAAVYAIGIVRNHPFVDGNKRTGFAALFMFLALNGAEFDPTEVDATLAILRLAAGDISDDEFIAWVRTNAHVPSDQGR